jgi:hypothetical protein
MTARERFAAALDHRLPERLPMDLVWPRAETIRLLESHFEVETPEEVLRRLGVDFRWVPLPMDYPEFREKAGALLSGDAPGAGERYIFHDRRTFEDHWGAVQRVGEDGKYLQWLDGPLAGKDSLEGWSLPKAVYPPVAEVSAGIEPIGAFVTVIEIEFPFKLARHLCGYEHFLVQMALNPAMVEELYDLLYAAQTEKAVLAARAGYDVVALVGDIAGQRGMLYSPEMFARYDAPRLARLIEQTRSANRNVKILYHSDGNLEAVIPLLIDCGVDILNPVQSSCMDPAAIKRKYGERLVFHGTISVQDTVPRGSVREVREEVAQRIRTVGYDGALVVSPENSIPFDAPLENILAIYETVRDFDYRTLEPP